MRRVAPGALTEESLCRSARRRTRLDDFGGEEFRLPLRLLLADLAEDENLGVVGRLAFRQVIVHGLVNRLRIAESLRRHPEIATVPVRAPLFVVGMPRTGTTLLHNLLAQDPTGRGPLLWELETPWPLPDPRRDRPDPRIRRTQRRIDRLSRFSPEGATIHEFHAEEPEECHYLFRNAMVTQTFLALADVPGFCRWKLSHDMLAEYRYYLLQLRMLLWQRPATHLVLKFPGHAWHVDALLAIFPDARVVFTHREPVEVVGSFCSMVARVRLAVSRDVDMHALGRLLADEIETGMRRMLAARERVDPSRFFDVRYADLVRDPGATVGEIYRHFGMPRAAEMGEAMERWLAEHRQHRHGKHVYRLSDYGLDEEYVRERFAFYYEQGFAMAAASGV